MRVYLDTCCLNRPYDSLEEERIRNEVAAIDEVLTLIRAGQIEWVVGDFLLAELDQMDDAARRAAIEHTMEAASLSVPITEHLAPRVEQLIALRIARADAMHVATAESAGVDVF